MYKIILVRGVVRAVERKKAWLIPHHMKTETTLGGSRNVSSIGMGDSNHVHRAMTEGL